MKYLFLAYIFFSANAFSSSCCGGGSSSSMIITGDNRAEMSLGYSFRNDIGQTNEDGWSTLNNQKAIDQRQSLNLQMQYQAFESWQFATKFSMVEKNLKKSGLNENNLGVGDVDLQTTFEYLPEYVYSAYKPRGFIYSKVTIPMSKGLYNSQSNIFSDVRGSGLYSVTLGNFLLKKFTYFSFKLTTEWTHYFGKNFSQFTLHDYEKFVLPIGVAFSYPESDFTFGLTDTFSYQTGKSLTGEINSASSKEYFWEVSAFINYSLNRNAIWSLSFSDSSLVGESINSPLYRTVSLNYTYAMAL